METTKNEALSMKYRESPGFWREVSLSEGPDRQVMGIRFGETCLDLEMESAYQTQRLEERRFRLRR